MKCSICQCDIKDGQVVYQLEGKDNVTVDYKKCQKEYEKGLEQADCALVWLEKRYQPIELNTVGCRVTKTVVDMKDDTPVVTMQISLPGGVSVDDIKEFSGKTVTVSLSKMGFVSTAVS